MNTTNETTTPPASASHRGVPAFPQSFTTITLDEKGKKIAQDYADYPGMDLPDWFAVQTIDRDIDIAMSECPVEINGIVQRRAWAKYHVAEATMAERARRANLQP